MAIVRKREPLNSGDIARLNFNFTAKLEGSATITGTPTVTSEVIEGDQTKNLTVSEIAVNNNDEEMAARGKKVSCLVEAPAGSAYIIWNVTASVASGETAYSTDMKVVGA